MGPIYDRSKEYLGSSDRGIIQFRRLMLDLATGRKQNGAALPGLDPKKHHVRATAMVLGENESWQETIKQLCVVRPGNWRQSPLCVPNIRFDVDAGSGRGKLPAR